jgi:hypothetical protein
VLILAITIIASPPPPTPLGRPVSILATINGFSAVII